MRAAALGFAISVFALTSASAQAPQGPEPFQLIRSLQMIQSQIAAGSQAAYLAQPRLMTQIADDFSRAPESVWREARNAQAAATYLFSGGLARVIRPLVQSNAIQEPDRPLVMGALAYVEGREQEALSLLMGIDARSVRPSLGGQLALVQAALIGAKDPAAASAFLDTARLLMPGSLVEEAALRRQIFMTDANVDLDKFFLMARQYFQRYRNSVYASNYWPRFNSLLSHSALSTKAGDFEKIETFLTGFKPNEQSDLYLNMARSAIQRGNARIAQRAAHNARKLSETGSVEAIRADLYEGAAMIAGNHIAAGLEKLESLPEKTLSNEERELGMAAKSLAMKLRAPPTPVSASAESLAQTPVSLPPSILVAQQAMAETDKFLSRNAQQ
ncbi:chemotaxis protein MotC [Beijerinckia sp. GAS462]|nr:chemotaxis protein MotC [Beijerinckia sp. GAS462]SED28199.1 chemotaxis protein MotC [Beijerinckia sp. 28-YEA-48]